MGAKLVFDLIANRLRLLQDGSGTLGDVFKGFDTLEDPFGIIEPHARFDLKDEKTLRSDLPTHSLPTPLRANIRRPGIPGRRKATLSLTDAASARLSIQI